MRIIINKTEINGKKYWDEQIDCGDFTFAKTNGGQFIMNNIYFDISAYACAFNNNPTDYSCACINLKKTPFNLATSFETWGWLSKS